MRQLPLLLIVIILTGPLPANSESFENHPVLRLFSREQKNDARRITKTPTSTQEETHLQIWTGTGTIAQQNKFLFSDTTTIDPNRENLKWWFRYNTTDEEPEFVLWQVSDRPYEDAFHLGKKPQGLIASGPVITQYGLGKAKLFEIEFEEIINLQAEKNTTANTTFYIRIITLDAWGKSVGPPSNTVMAHYGLNTGQPLAEP